MTLEAQRIVIAEACGHIEPQYYEGFGWCSRNKDGRAHVTVPDYLGDLNAMHEAEKVLTTDKQKDDYHDAICDVLIGGSCFRWTDTFSVITATAAQRAEAFLRTLGLWKE